MTNYQGKIPQFAFVFDENDRNYLHFKEQNTYQI